MSWRNQYQVWTQPQNAPAGWAGSWPPTAPAGYPGPPPLPAGVNVNPQQWVSGQWMLNPMYRGPVSSTQGSFQMWAAHPSWGPGVAHASAAAAAATNYNPYKRIPNRGDAEYWKTKLLDNPLGLENMHIRDDTPQEERHVKDSPNGVPHTPWVWVPRELGKPEDGNSSDPRSAQSVSAAPAAAAQPPHTRDASRAPDSHPRVNTHDGLSHAPPLTHTHAQERSASQPLVTPRHPHKLYGPFPPTQPFANEGSSPPGYPPDSQRNPTSGKPPTVAPRAPPILAQGGVIPPPPEPLPPGSAASYAAYQHQQQLKQQQQQQQQTQRQPQQQFQQHQRTQSRDVSPRQSEQTRDTRTSPRVSVSTASAAAAAAAASRVPVSSTSSASKSQSHSRSEAFSTRLDLHPTFSTSIVRTPDHYSAASSTTPTRRSSHDDADRTPSRPPVSPYSHGPIYGPPTPTRSNSTPSRHSSTASTTASSASSAMNAAPSILTSVSSFSEEPAALLSPLVGIPAPHTPNGSSPSSRQLTRSQTYPFESIPEGRASQPHTPEARTPRTPRTPRPPEREREQDRDPNATPHVVPRTPTHVMPDVSSRQLSRSQTYPSLDSSPQPSPTHAPSRSRPSPSSEHTRQLSRSQTFPMLDPSPQPSPTHTRSRSRGPSPSEHARHLSNTFSNPLPAPPRPSTYVSSASFSSSMSSTQQSHHTHTTSVSAAASAAHNRSLYIERRIGYWNRRGDHLIVEKDRQFIVYAPRSLANPSDLAQYPTPTEGFMDQFGNKIKYDPTVPELSESLPLHGEPPKQPYDRFVHYMSVYTGGQQ
ncbi:hypothetical protein BKA93DRAFT_190462 [Sparassis latifolia]